MEDAHPAVDGQCPRCGTHLNEPSRRRVCLPRLQPGEGVGEDNVVPQRRAWEDGHPDPPRPAALPA